MKSPIATNGSVTVYCDPRLKFKASGDSTWKVCDFLYLCFSSLNLFLYRLTFSQISVGNIFSDTDITIPFLPIKHFLDDKVFFQVTFHSFALQNSRHSQVVVKFKIGGAKYLRVITKKIPITYDEAQMNRAAKCDVIGMQVRQTGRTSDQVKDILCTYDHFKAVQESARLAQRGQYQEARINLISNMRLLQRCMKSKTQQEQYVQKITDKKRNKN